MKCRLLDEGRRADTGGFIYLEGRLSRHLRRVGFVHSSRLVAAVRVRRRTVRLAGTTDDVEANTNSSCSSLYARGGITGKFVSCQPQRLAAPVRVRRPTTVRLAGTADDVEANMNSPFWSRAGLAGTAKRFVLCQPRGHPSLFASEGTTFASLVRQRERGEHCSFIPVPMFASGDEWLATLG